MGGSSLAGLPVVTEIALLPQRMSISRDGGFEINGQAYRIPEHFAPPVVSSYRTLLRPVPDIPGGTRLTLEQRAVTQAYLHRRAAACVIPGFRMSISALLSPAEVEKIHRWIADHRPELGDVGPASARSVA